ncbi:MAG: sodium:proton antiporter [Balneolaceae bacterium]|nr:sodium:proton antiporter [Balneolaceae bacterium]
MAEQILLGLVSIIFFGIGAQWLAWRTKLPAILLLLIAGIVAGATGLLNPDLVMGDLFTPFISLSVGIILFEGGLSLRFSELKDIGGDVIKLVSIGVVVTLVLVSISAYYLFDMSVELSVLLGAILVVTGPTVIIPLLRQVRPTGQVSSVLKWEGIVIDPIGALLAVLVYEVIFTSSFGEATSLALGSIFKTVFFGTLVGLAGAAIIYWLLRRYLLPDFLQNPVNLMIVVLVFGISDMLQHESGLWATTVMGIALANQKSARIHHIVEFKENLRVLLLSALFILLAARVELQELIAVLNWKIFVFLGVLILIARPLSVYLSTLGSKLHFKEKLFLSWMAPRGVVAASISSLFALGLVENGYAEAEQIIPIVLIVIISTVAIYGLSASKVAEWLNVKKPTPRGFLIIGAHPWARELGQLLKQENFKVILADSNWSNINKTRKLGLNTYYGNVLGENAIEDLNLDGVGKLLTLTPNDEVNSLAVLRYSNVFGSSEVFQLPASTQVHLRDREMPDNLSGRFLFNENVTFDKIDELTDEGYRFKVIPVHSALSQQEFEETFSENHIPMILITNNREAIPYTVDNLPLPQEGHKVLCLVNPDYEHTLNFEKELTSETGDQPEDQKN